MADEHLSNNGDQEMPSLPEQQQHQADVPMRDGLIPPIPLSPRGGARTHPLMPPPASPTLGRLRSHSMDHHLGALSPLPSYQLPRSVPVSPVTGRPFNTSTALMNASIPPPFSVTGVPAPIPPEPSERQKAMEAVVAAERKRVKDLEEGEAEMSADELRAVLKSERRRMAKIAADLAAFRMAAVELQLEAEVIEEGRINQLMRRLDHLQQEKGKIIFELEREEEMLTNTLQKQLNELRREKALLQQQIDREKKSNSSLENHLSSLKGSNMTMGQVVEEAEEEEEDEGDCFGEQDEVEAS